MAPTSRTLMMSPSQNSPTFTHIFTHTSTHTFTHTTPTTPFLLACVQCTGKYDTLKNIPDPAKVVEAPKFKQVSLRGK